MKCIRLLFFAQITLPGPHVNMLKLFREAFSLSRRYLIIQFEIRVSTWSMTTRTQVFRENENFREIVFACSYRAQVELFLHCPFKIMHLII